MGICNQKQTLNLQPARVPRASSRQSFLYSSFTYDPTYSSEPNFFFFDLPHYCEIQYILRKQNIKDTPQVQQNIQKHIEQIEQAVQKIKSKQFMPGTKLVQGGNFNKDKDKDKDKLKYENENENRWHQKQKQKQTKESLLSQSSTSCQYDHILNFQLVSISLNQCEDIKEACFEILLNDDKIMSIQGSIDQNKWKPTSTNKISIPNTNLQIQNMKKQVYIKICSTIQDQTLECTIPCNKMTFKYIIPVLQTSNLRGKLDAQPVGHVHFKIQYIHNFYHHKLRVVTDLEGRKKGLMQILDRVKNKNGQAPLDKSLILEDYVESFKSDLMEDSYTQKMMEDSYKQKITGT